MSLRGEFCLRNEMRDIGLFLRLGDLVIGAVALRDRRAVG
jgi:hypothetical protein